MPLTPTLNPSLSDVLAYGPNVIGWFESPSGSGAPTGPITLWIQIEEAIDYANESFVRFEAYLDDVATPYDTYDEFLAGGTFEDLFTWWDANP